MCRGGRSRSYGDTQRHHRHSSDAAATRHSRLSQEWVDLAANEFDGQIEVGDDLHTVTIGDKEKGE